MYTDHTPPEDPTNVSSEFWTVTLVSDYGETNFGVFTFDEVREAMESGKVKTHGDDRLKITRIRRFPTGD